jgi:ATP-dependent Lon protease
MPRDQKMTKREQIKRSKKSDDKMRNRKGHKDSDDDEHFIDDDDEDFIDDDEEEEEMDVHEYRKFLGKLFPSKNQDKKVEMGEKIKKLLKTVPSDDDESLEEEEKVSKKKQSSKKKKAPIKKSKRVEELDEDEDDFEEQDSKKGNKFNIIFTIGGHEDDEEWEDYDDEDEWTDEDDETEDEDEEVSSDESDSDSDSDDEEDEDEDEDEIVTRSKSKDKKKETKKGTKKDTNKGKEEKEEEVVDGSNNVVDNDEIILKNLKEFQEKNKSNKMVAECIKVCEKQLKDKKKKTERKIEKTKEKHERIFRRVVRDKNTMNDFAFFSKLEPEEQKKIIKEVREINKITRVEKPYRLTLLEADIPPIFKAAAMKKINSLRYMEPGSGEFYKSKNWVDAFMRIPFGKYKTLPVTITDGVDKCHEFMADAQKSLNDAVYGLNDAKMQIMQMLGQLITNPSAIGTAIAIHGPPGTGKTSLVKEGISKILNRPFAFIALGGATDSSFLEGHSYTYEGSMWGKIVQILIDSKCMNPVIYFDELDKISDTPKGEEIAGILTHLTDTSQNSQFHDKYFAEIDFDLSKCLFIFSYNDESKVNPILKDRMYRIMTKGYDKKQKTIISDSYLLPRIREQVKFTEEDIIIPQETLHHIIDTHCDKEDGVRNLKRCMEIVYTKLNLYRLMRPESNLFEEEMSLKVEFPFTVTKEIVDKLIKKDRDINMSWRAMYM